MLFPLTHFSFRTAEMDVGALLSAFSRNPKTVLDRRGCDLQNVVILGTTHHTRVLFDLLSRFLTRVPGFFGPATEAVSRRHGKSLEVAVVATRYIMGSVGTVEHDVRVGIPAVVAMMARHMSHGPVVLQGCCYLAAAWDAEAARMGSLPLVSIRVVCGLAAEHEACKQLATDLLKKAKCNSRDEWQVSPVHAVHVVKVLTYVAPRGKMSTGLVDLVHTLSADNPGDFRLQRQVFKFCLATQSFGKRFFEVGSRIRAIPGSAHSLGKLSQLCARGTKHLRDEENVLEMLALTKHLLEISKLNSKNDGRLRTIATMAEAFVSRFPTSWAVFDKSVSLLRRLVFSDLVVDLEWLPTVANVLLGLLKQSGEGSGGVAVILTTFRHLVLERFHLGLDASAIKPMIKCCQKVLAVVEDVGTLEVACEALGDLKRYAGAVWLDMCTLPLATLRRLIERRCFYMYNVLTRTKTSLRRVRPLMSNIAASGYPPPVITGWLTYLRSCGILWDTRPYICQLFPDVVLPILDAYSTSTSVIEGVMYLFEQVLSVMRDQQAQDTLTTIVVASVRHLDEVFRDMYIRRFIIRVDNHIGHSDFFFVSLVQALVLVRHPDAFMSRCGPMNRPPSQRLALATFDNFWKSHSAVLKSHYIKFLWAVGAKTSVLVAVCTAIEQVKSWFWGKIRRALRVHRNPVSLCEQRDCWDRRKHWIHVALGRSRHV